METDYIMLRTIRRKLERIHEHQSRFLSKEDILGLRESFNTDEGVNSSEDITLNVYIPNK